MQTIGLKSPVSAVETVGADMSEGLQVSSEWAGPLGPYLLEADAAFSSFR